MSERKMRTTAIFDGVHLRRYAPRHRRPAASLLFRSPGALLLRLLAVMLFLAILLTIIVGALTSTSQEAALFAQNPSAHRSPMTVTTGPVYYSQNGEYNITVPAGSILFTDQALIIHALTGSTVYVQNTCRGQSTSSLLQECAQVYAQQGARVFVGPRPCAVNGQACDSSNPIVYSWGAVVTVSGGVMVYANDHSVVYAYGQDFVQGQDSTFYAHGQSVLHVAHSVVYAYDSSQLEVSDHSTVVAYGNHKPNVAAPPIVAPIDCSSQIYAGFGEEVQVYFRDPSDPNPQFQLLPKNCVPDIHLDYGAILMIFKWVAALGAYSSQPLWCHQATSFKAYQSVCNMKPIHGDETETDLNPFT